MENTRIPDAAAHRCRLAHDTAMQEAHCIFATELVEQRHIGFQHCVPAHGQCCRIENTVNTVHRADHEQAGQL